MASGMREMARFPAPIRVNARRRGPEIYQINSVGDPHVIEPPGSGSGSISQRYSSGSGTFPFLKNLIFKTEDDVPVGELQDKNMGKKLFFFLSLIL